MGRLGKFFLFAILSVMSIHTIRGDVAEPITHYLAMPEAKWRQALGLDVDANVGKTKVANAENTVTVRIEDTDVVILLVPLMLIGLIIIIASMRNRKYRALFLLLPMEILLLGAEVWFFWKSRQKGNEQRRGQEDRQMNEVRQVGGLSEWDFDERNEEVSPEPSESYEEYLKRVDRLERHICLKCDTQMQHRLYSWHCPKCEPDYFVCEKCGGTKEEAYSRGRYLRCPKCGKEDK